MALPAFLIPALLGAGGGALKGALDGQDGNMLSSALMGGLMGGVGGHFAGGMGLDPKLMQLPPNIGGPVPMPTPQGGNPVPMPRMPGGTGIPMPSGLPDPQTHLYNMLNPPTSQPNPQHGQISTTKQNPANSNLGSFLSQMFSGKGRGNGPAGGLGATGNQAQQPMQPLTPLRSMAPAFQPLPLPQLPQMPQVGAGQSVYQKYRR